MKTNNNIEEQKLNYQKTVNIIFLAITKENLVYSFIRRDKKKEII